MNAQHDAQLTRIEAQIEGRRAAAISQEIAPYAYAIAQYLGIPQALTDGSSGYEYSVDRLWVSMNEKKNGIIHVWVRYAGEIVFDAHGQSLLHESAAAFTGVEDGFVVTAVMEVWSLTAAGLVGLVPD